MDITSYGHRTTTGRGLDCHIGSALLDFYGLYNHANLPFYVASFLRTLSFIIYNGFLIWFS